MKFTLKEVSGLTQAMTSLMMSKRHYNPERHDDLMRKLNWVTDYKGFIRKDCPYDPPADKYACTVNGAPCLLTYDEVYQEIVGELTKLAKWGAGVGGEAWIDDGHETLLRYIDFTFVVEDLHRGAMDDLDAHAQRFNNRIVRSSTRYDGAYKQSERSDWYKERIVSTEEALAAAGISIPGAIVIGGTNYVKVPNGYAVSGLEKNGDVLRGNYPLSIPMSAVMKIDLVNLRHVYMRRNKFTKASPELRDGIEMLADQIEQAVPGDLGKLVRYDYALIPDATNDGVIYIPYEPTYNLVHIMNVRKVFYPRGEAGKYDMPDVDVQVACKEGREWTPSTKIYNGTQTS